MVEFERLYLPPRPSLSLGSKAAACSKFALAARRVGSGGAASLSGTSYSDNIYCVLNTKFFLKVTFDIWVDILVVLI